MEGLSKCCRSVCFTPFDVNDLIILWFNQCAQPQLIKYCNAIVEYVLSQHNFDSDFRTQYSIDPVQNMWSALRGSDAAVSDPSPEQGELDLLPE